MQYIGATAKLFVDTKDVADIEKAIYFHRSSFHAMAHDMNERCGHQVFDVTGESLRLAWIMQCALYATAVGGHICVPCGAGCFQKARDKWNEIAMLAAQTYSDELVKVVVMDGIQGMASPVCGETTCKKAPMKTRCAFFDEATGEYCEEECEEGKKCCAEHAHVEAQYGGRVPSHRMRFRDKDETQKEWEEDNRLWFKHRHTHLFDRKYEHGRMFWARPCGIIVATERLLNSEAATEKVMQAVDTAFPGEVEADFMVYDRACFVRKAIQEGGPLNGMHGRWFNAVKWLVDRFHFHGHSPNDEHCRTHCNPYDLKNEGLYEVLSFEILEDETCGEGDHVDEEERSPVGRKARVEVDGVLQNVRYVQEMNEEGMWERFMVKDVVNTEVCEQVFSHFQGFSGVYRRMGRAMSELFIIRMIVIHNYLRTALMERKKKENLAPRPTSKEMNPCVMRSADHDFIGSTGRAWN
ncbi:hypothetical protein RI054_22g96750 [Pseudoscourfieldia marina]